MDLLKSAQSILEQWDVSTSFKNASPEKKSNIPARGSSNDLQSFMNKLAPEPPTFAEITQLVKDGKPVPGIENIPDTLSTEKPSSPLLQPVIKPWEKDPPISE